MATAPIGSIDSWVEDEINAFFSTPTIGQTMRYRAYCQIWLDGVDVTNRLAPYLISVTVHDTVYWTAKIELDDRDGKLDIPPFNATLTIFLGWVGSQLTDNVVKVFEGVVDNVEHGFGRRLGGRRMFIHADTRDFTSLIKTPFQDHIGDGAPPGQMQGTLIPFSAALAQFANNAGMTAVIGGSFGGVQRDYWSMNNESIMEWVTRYKDELGGWSRIVGNTVIFQGTADFNNTPVTAQWGNNLISWRVTPRAARGLWGGSTQPFFDHVQGLWNKDQQQFGMPAPWGGAAALFSLPMPAPNSGVAQQQNQGTANKAAWLPGYGRIIINGEPAAAWGGTVNLLGARPGVDGSYYIFGVTHTYSRQGYVSTLEVFPNTESIDNNIGSQGYDSEVNSAVLLQLQKQVALTGQPQTINNPNGSTTTYYPNGTIVIKNAIGITTIAPDGTQTFTSNGNPFAPNIGGT